MNSPVRAQVCRAGRARRNGASTRSDDTARRGAYRGILLIHFIRALFGIGIDNDRISSLTSADSDTAFAATKDRTAGCVCIRFILTFFRIGSDVTAKDGTILDRARSCVTNDTSNEGIDLLAAARNVSIVRVIN